jgi:hypothetical protein
LELIVQKSGDVIERSDNVGEENRVHYKQKKREKVHLDHEGSRNVEDRGKWEKKLHQR